METPPIPELERLKDRYPDKFVPEDRVFSHVRRGDRIFIGTACGEPQHLMHALTNWVRANPKALFDAEKGPASRSTVATSTTWSRSSAWRTSTGRTSGSAPWT